MVAAEKNKKPTLKNLDDLFNLTDGVKPLEQSVSIMETQPISKRMVSSVMINNLTPFKGHPFKLYEGERLDDMVESIRANGVLVPIIVRRIDTTLEILAGHNRVNAAKLAGLDEISTIVLENISDEDAIIYVVETNLLQRSFSDMTHSEKATVIALHHSKMFSQGKRNDILEQLKILENPHSNGEKSTCSQLANKLKTITKVGQEYGLSKDTIARYLRVNQLIPALKSRLDNGSFSFIPAVTLSFLKNNEQESVDDCMNQYDFTVDMKKADMLRDFSEKGKLNAENVLKILSGEATQKSNHTTTIKIKKAVYMKYFKPEQSVKEIQETVEKALEMYFKR